MDLGNKVTNSRSLPPLVEGKVHGYLRLVIDEIVWSRRSPGDVTVLASWWGELDSAQFRPADIKSGENRLECDIAEKYAIRTNLDLFEEYLKNCETVELVVISKSHQVIGTAQVSDLSNLLNGKSYFEYVPVLNDNGNRIGDIHITMKLSPVPKNLSPIKKENKNMPDEKNIISSRFDILSKNIFPYENDVPVALKNAKQNENVYRSILKERLDFENLPKSSSAINDKLVAQVVARAQRLRGAILKEAQDPLALSESSTIDSYRSDQSNNEANLYEYFLGKKMSRYEEKKALQTLRATSPTPSLIDLASETIRTCRNEKNVSPVEEKCRLSKSNRTDDISIVENSPRQAKENVPIDYVDSLRIAVESLTLSPAGYRRVRSSCLSRGDGIPISVTYFVQYEANFGNRKKFNRKIINESKPVKLCSKKQIGQVVYFNHEAVYDLPRTYLHMEIPMKFKIYNRHLNQRTPTELGIGSINVADAARARSLSSTQRLAIVNKGIKIGELKVTVELGCDKIHFGKQFVEAVTSAKENIPVLDVSSNSSLETPRYRRATGSESKENEKSSSSSGNRPEMAWNGNNTDRISRQESIQRREPRGDERLAELENPRGEADEKILLHCLIYIAEGKDFSSLSTYLICRAFWREDKAASRICDETNNPFYNFHQLVPLIHGPDLLERTRDNCIVVEVYSKTTNGGEELVGISKLPVHQLYVAYRDPQVLPHLLRSKYPVISVDGWVSVDDPVNSRSCGQILALVALGTADQIALLEMTRGLRDSRAPPHYVDRRNPEISRFADTRLLQNDFQQNGDNRSYENHQIWEKKSNGIYDNFQANERSSENRFKTQECQTEITTVKYFKPSHEDEFTSENPQSFVLNAIVDRLAQALNVPKFSADQAAQTELDIHQRNSDELTNIHYIQPVNLNSSTNASFSGSDTGSRDNFHLSREIYRSVGVGAEFDDPVNQGASTSYANPNSIGISNGFNAQLANFTENKNNAIPEFDDKDSASIRLPNSREIERLDSEREMENSYFRAVIEIECALHLPKVEKIEEMLDPCTYVTFQKARNKNETQYGCYVVTNLFPFSCSPKWDWRCDTKLSNDLLDNEEKRLILKVWRLADPETSMEINLERDIVIGFSAIDLSVLTVGFPVVSGWFHVMDFTGKCNGQIKVSVTPLDNIAGFGKFPNTAKPPPNLDHSNFSSPYPTNLPNELQNSVTKVQEVATNRSHDQEPLDIGLGLGDASMSFLSLSLKQKLSELDEIKKRLQTRLHDVTNTAFDDDFDNDFDMPENDNDNENNGNTESNILRDMENWIPRETINHENSIRATNGNRNFDEIENGVTSNSASTEANFTDTGYSSSNVQSTQNGNRYVNSDDNRFRSDLTSEENINGYESVFGDNSNLPNGHKTTTTLLPNLRNRTDILNVRNYRSERDIVDFRQNENSENITDDRSNGSSEDNPIRGTRMHISHLLDKLTTQLTAVPPTTNQPMKKNIMDLITSLRRNNNNFTNDVKCNREVNVRTVPTQTETNYTPETQFRLKETVAQFSKNNSTETRENFTTNERNRDYDETPAKNQRKINKVSTVIREELAADESNEIQGCDELSTHLMASNVRHMNLDSILNPLLYPHLIPDVRTADNEVTNCQNSPNQLNNPEIEAIERLDTRYTENFNATINNGLSRLRNLMAENSMRNQSVTNSDNDTFRLTPSTSENIDGNIDVTVIHKPCNDDLMASNSLESTTTISLENDLLNATEIDDNSSLNSSATSLSAVSRQAPDGGNPAEESGSVIVKPPQDSQDSSSS